MSPKLVSTVSILDLNHIVPFIYKPALLTLSYGYVGCLFSFFVPVLILNDRREGKGVQANLFIGLHYYQSIKINLDVIHICNLCIFGSSG